MIKDQDNNFQVPGLPKFENYNLFQKVHYNQTDIQFHNSAKSVTHV